MVVLSSTLLWTVSDTLGAEVTYDRKLNRVRGEGTKSVDFFGFPVNFHSRIVSSLVLKDRSLLLLVRVKGNFCMLVHVEPAQPHETVTVHFLNLAKLDGQIENWLENVRPKNAEACERALQNAIKTSFQKKTKKTWYELKR